MEIILIFVFLGFASSLFENEEQKKARKRRLEEQMNELNHFDVLMG
jgi:hypothetical protein